MLLIEVACAGNVTDSYLTIFHFPYLPAVDTLLDVNVRLSKLSLPVLCRMHPITTNLPQVVYSSCHMTKYLNHKFFMINQHKI